MTPLLDRFLRYVRVDTQSDPTSKAGPSTPGQWDLLRLLEAELGELGAEGVRLTDNGYLLARLPGRSGAPTLALLAHVDTAPDFPGKGVKPLVHRDYRGGPIALPDDPSQVLDPEDPRQEELRSAVGKDLVTASGRTLLGADDKAGVAVLMTLAERLLADPRLPRCPVVLCFTPDEEIGRGVDGLDLAWLGADAAYTLDGGAPGELNWETFSADEAVVTVRGVATHPGQARRHGLVNAVHLSAKLLALLPREALSPEATDGRQGFVHPTRIEGDAAKTTVTLILRDHDDDKLAEQGRMLQALCRAVQAAHPGARVTCRRRRQYRNMGRWLRDRMLPVDLARQALAAAGLAPAEVPVRGGTDGARLTERGLPCPNLFCGAHNPHGPLEWVAREDMEQAVEVLVHLVGRWAEQGRGDGP
ncbi:MAG: peptidase T [Deferrisomatales bacterium]